MGLEHELEDLVVDSIEKGTVKAVEKLIDKGLINEVVQITLCELNKEIPALIELGLIAIIALGALESSKLAGIQASVSQAMKATKEVSLKQVQDILINLMKTKFGNECMELAMEIRKIKEIDKINLLAQRVLECNNLEEFKCIISSENIS